MDLRESTTADEREILQLHLLAFGEQEGPEIAELVAALWRDESALPLLSLVALEGDRIVGHILFTRVQVLPENRPVQASILCPLAVLPAAQARGVGGRLIAEGLQRLGQSGVQLVFVLGHPDYYPRSGFTPAGVHGLDAPYPILPEHAAAWMVQALRPGLLDSVTGTVRCSDVLNDPRYWGPPEEADDA